jgi:CHAD domain-containing protein
VHSLGCERATIKPAGPQADHFLLPVDDLEREVRPDLHHNHVDGVRADVDGGDAHSQLKAESCVYYNEGRGPALYIMPVSTTRSELLKKRLDRFTRVLQGVEQGDVRALHRARVASRRLRELVPVLQLDPSSARKLGRRLRKVTTRLGTVRELDVLLLLIDELHVSRRDWSSALSRVGVSVSKSRDEARERLAARLPTDEMRRLARKLDRVSDDLRATETATSKTAARSWRWAIDARVASRAARLLTAMADAGALYLPERLHAVRIAMKKLRYSLELSAEATTGKAATDLRALKRGQELLGRMHDLQMLIDHVRKVQASLTPPNVTVWRDVDALRVSLEDDCRRLHARYMRGRDALAAVAERLAEPPGPAARTQAARRAG